MEVENQSEAYQYLVTDSRQISFPNQSLFFAIKGPRHDGHQYLQELYDKGVRQFVVESEQLSPRIQQQLNTWTDATVSVVPNSITALQSIAIKHREQFHIPIVGITGSNGKTVIKEWLSQLLADTEAVISNPKSYNSQIGVPLSVWNLASSHTIGIFEAGISQPMEMEKLQPIIQPTWGIFTNIGTAHDEGFKSIRQKITEKLKLFVKSKKLIYCADYTDIDAEVKNILKPTNQELELIHWTTDESNSSNSAIVVNYDLIPGCICFAGKFGNHAFKVPFTDKASRENLTHCLVFLLAYGFSSEHIQHRIEELKPVAMRLELKEGVHGMYLIDDSYNNDMYGLQLALQFLKKQDQRPMKAVILSDVLQSGLPLIDLYTQVGKLIQEVGINQVIGIGEQISAFSHLIPAESTHFFPDTASFLTQFNPATLANHVVLLKGARAFQLERIVERFQQKIHKTRLEVNLDALTHNLNYYKSLVGPTTKIMGMVKAFAYGSGSVEIANTLQFNRVDYLTVAYPDEGIALRQNGITLPIMVMNTATSNFAILCHYNLEPEIYSRNVLESWIEFTRQKTTKRIPAIHLKLDTGMHRLGFVKTDYEWLGSLLTKHPEIRVASIFTHLVGADEGIHNPFSRQQYQNFIEGATYLEKVLGYSPLKHILNSAGIVRFPEFKLDMVRVGIGLYGVEATGEKQRYLQNVGTLKTVISQIKEIPAGESIGYSRRGMLAHHARIATIAIGYADGYDRRLGNGVGQVSVNGTLCPTVGNVCMDMTMIDITHAKANEGDDVIIFGTENSVTNMAKAIGTIPYEIFTGISERVKRVFYKE